MAPIVFFTEFIRTSRSQELKLESCATVKYGSSLKEEVLVEEARDAVVIISDNAPIQSRLIDAAPNLRAIIAYGVGYNHIDVKAASERGIFVVNLPESNSEAVAEMAVSLMLTLARRVNRSDQFIKNRKWNTTETSTYPTWMVGEDLYEKTLGLVGIGAIGRRVARICRNGFKMLVMASDPFVTKEYAMEIGAELLDLTEVLRRSDFISVHVPLTDKTRALIGAKEFGMMKKTAYLINTSRGPVVDERALVRALIEKSIAGAGLDVFEKEPIPTDSPLLQLENVVMSPHIASSTQEAHDYMNNMMVEAACRVIKGENPSNIVNLPQITSMRHASSA